MLMVENIKSHAISIQTYRSFILIEQNYAIITLRIRDEGTFVRGKYVYH